MISKRLEWVDLVKGIAIILVVVGHMLRGFTSANMFSGSNQILDYIDFTIYSFHMPLFFIISGYLYMRTYSINKSSDYLLFIKKKIKTLIFPYFIFSWLQIIIKLIMAGSVNHNVEISDFYTIVLYPIEQFWFLYALFIIFIIMAFLDFKVNKSIKVLIIISLFLIGNSQIIEWGILNGALTNLLYFYLGRLLLEIDCEKLKHNSLIFYFILVAYLILNLMTYTFSINGFLLIVSRLLMALLFSIVSILLCIKISNKQSLIIHYLINIGKYSMSIYLLHTIFGSGIRIILVKMGIESMFIHIIAGLFFGIIPPMVISYIYKRILKFRGEYFMPRYKNRLKKLD